jgi:RND superfamily putative drug exporter
VRRLLTIGARRPRAALVAWLVVTAVLGVIGLNVGQHLSASNLSIPGTESAREYQLFQQRFGHSVSAPILLQGPAAALDREGPRLAAGLAALTGSHVVSAWNGNSLGKTLRPTPTNGLVLVSITPRPHVSDGAIERAIKRVIDRTVTGPVHARVSGLDAIGTQLEAASFSAVRKAELIAIPILLVVLLVVFGSPAAAAIPAVLGFGTVFAGFGLISLIASLTPLTELATSSASMMGLALGVDYSLLVVSRFRDELDGSADPEAIRSAATVAALRAGRTVAFAGGAIALLMLTALVVSAGTLLLSAVLGVIVVAMVSVVGTVVACPAALTLFGRHVARRTLHAPRRTAAVVGPAIPRPYGPLLSRSRLAAPLTLAVLLALAWEATSLATGPPDARQLPANSTARKDFEQVSRTIGQGWVTPFELTAVVPNGAITTLPRLDALAATQKAIRSDPDVAAIIGPGALARRARPLLHAEASIARTNASLKRSAQDVTGLSSSLGQAATGAQHVQSGFAQAATAVKTLAGGGAGGGAAVAALRSGLIQAADGSRQSQQGLVRAEQAAARVAAGGSSAAAGAARLATQLDAGSATAASAQPKLNALAQQLQANAATAKSLADPVGALDSNLANVSSQLANAASSLAAMHLGRFDSRYGAVLAAVRGAQGALANTPSSSGLADQLRQLSANDQQASSQASSLAGAVATLGQAASQLAGGAHSLRDGLAQLDRSQRALAAGIQQLASSGVALTNGLTSLSTGTATLGARLAALESGAQQIASGLAGEQQQTGALTNALTAGQQSAKNQKQVPGANVLTQLAQTPGVFNSGYLVLAGLEGAKPSQRAGLDFTINVARDGQAARMLIVPRSAADSPATAALRKRLESAAQTLAAATGAQVAVGGPAAALRDYAGAASGRMPLLIGALLLVSFLLLVPVFRSLLAPLVGVLLNLVTVGAAFGILSFLTGGHNPLIGGPGYVDALSVSAMFTAVFGLSIDYQVFLLMRMREGWLRTGNVRDGVDYGIARTARVVVGAAAIMAGVFLAFASADVATIRQLGVGLAIAVVIDATIVRLVLLPAALRLGGRFTWWLPAWLDRRLPALDIGADRRRRDRQRIHDEELEQLDAHAGGVVTRLPRPVLADPVAASHLAGG